MTQFLPLTIVNVGYLSTNYWVISAGSSRLLVDRSIKDAFMEKLVARARKMVPGDPLDARTRLGAIASKLAM